LSSERFHNTLPREINEVNHTHFITVVTGKTHAVAREGWSFQKAVKSMVMGERIECYA
jgi:hypothetical protein